MKTIEILLSKVPHIYARPYKGGVEIRTQNLEKAKDDAQRMISANGWKIEIFDTDIRLRSFAVRVISQEK